MDIFKMIMDQAAGVAIAILLIMRIETKLDGLTNAVIKLSEAIRPTGKDSLQTHDQFLYLRKWKKSKNFQKICVLKVAPRGLYENMSED